MNTDENPIPHPDDPTASLRPDAPRDSAPDRLSPGSIIADRYRIVRRIGVGGMGEVFHATDEQLHRAVALKIIGPLGEDADGALSEARKAARLRHPGIAAVHDAGILRVDGAGATAFIAMELVAGAERLDAWARRTNPDLPHLARMLADVCDAIAHAHARGVIHGDLKPGNILVDADGTPRVIDFGVARALGVDESLQESRGGTPGYAAPEQEHANAGPLDGRADVYALGVLARELTRSTPATDSQARDLGAIIDAATHTSRADRLGTSAELGANLRALAAGQPAPIAHRTTLARLHHRARGAARRHPLASAFACALIGVIVAATVAVPVVSRWTPLDPWLAAALRPVPRFGTAGAPLDRVCTVLLDDGDDIEALAATEGLVGVRTDQLYSWRRLHGRMMERLATAHPRAVAWDIRFAEPSDFDAELVEGIRAVEATGAGVAVATTDWKLDDEGLPSIVRPVLEIAGWGVASGVHNAVETWRVDLVLDRNDGTPARHALAVQALAAARGADAEIDATIDHTTGIVRLRFWRPIRGVAAGRAWVGPEVPMRVSSVERIDADNPTMGLHRADRMGVLEIDVPPDAVLASAQLSYTDMFLMPAQELRDRISGRIVVVGNIRSGRDIHPHSSGRMIPGPWAHACAIDALDRNTSARRPAPGTDVAMMALCALGGAAAGWAGSGTMRARLVFLACLAVLCTIVTLGIYALRGIVLNTAVQAVAAVLAWELAAWAGRGELQGIPRKRSRP